LKTDHWPVAHVLDTSLDVAGPYLQTSDIITILGDGGLRETMLVYCRMLLETRILARSITATLILVFSSAAFAQATQGGVKNPVHVSGRLVDSQGAPYSDTTIVFGSTAGPGYRKEQVDTDQKGGFDIELQPHTGYEVWLSASKSSALMIGKFSFGDVQIVDLGNIHLDSLPDDKFALHVPGLRFKGFANADSSARVSNAAIVAIYIDCPNASDTYCRDARAHIFLADGTNVMPPLEKGQVGASQPQVSFDNRSAGWLVDFDNCCTSYPLSLPLVIYRPGKPQLTFRGDARAIFDWHFFDGGKRFAMCQEFPHGNLMPHYELHEVDSGRLLDKWDEDGSDDEQNNQAPEAPAPKAPAWVTTFVGNC
jgi:hypothetical protein